MNEIERTMYLQTLEVVKWVVTSVFIPLFIYTKEPRKYWSNDDAFPKKELYLNVSNNISLDDEEEVYEFKFIDSNKIPDDGKKWFKVKEVLNYNYTMEKQ